MRPWHIHLGSMLTKAEATSASDTGAAIWAKGSDGGASLMRTTPCLDVPVGKAPLQASLKWSCGLVQANCHMGRAPVGQVVVDCAWTTV